VCMRAHIRVNMSDCFCLDVWSLTLKEEHILREFRGRINCFP
jgi:hypothetical protein